MHTPTRLRPMDLGDLFDAGFRLYRSQFLTFIGIVAILQVPMAIAQFVAQIMFGNVFTQLMRLSSQPGAIIGADPFNTLPITDLLWFYAILVGLALFQYLIAQNLVGGALTSAIARGYANQPIGILEAYRYGMRHFGALLLASIAQAGIGIIGFVVAFGCMIGAALVGVRAIPGISSAGAIAITVLMIVVLLVVLVPALLFFYTRFLLTVPAIMLEELGPLAGLGRSWRLIRGSFWRTAVIVLLLGLLSYLISSLPAQLASFAITIGSRGDMQRVMLGFSVATLVGYLGLIVVQPLQTMIQIFLYYDLRVRKEGYDIEMMARQGLEDGIRGGHGVE